MRLTRLLALLGAALAVLLLSAPVASAAGAAGDCREEPVPEMPGRGVTGWVTSPPAHLPPAGVRFTKDGVPLYDQWAMAGMHWNTYDLGCPGNDIMGQADATLGTTVANWSLELPKFGVAVNDAVTRVAYHPTFLDSFNPLIANTVDTLRSALFNKWAPVFLVLAGVLVLWKATRLRVASAATVVAWGLLVMVVATVLFQWPVKAGNYVDGAVGKTVGAVHNGINRTHNQDPASATTQSVYYAVLWQQWKAGVFGDGNSVTANKYADDLFAAQALTWREARIVQNDPDGRGQDIIDAKQDQFYDTANKIKDDDPDAYEYLTGHQSETRVGMAALALFAAACVLPLLFMAALLILASYLIIRMAVMLFPIVATVGVSYTFRGVVKGIATACAAAVINSLAFAVGGAILTLIVRIVLGPESRLPLWLGIIICALVSVLMWFALKPFRRLTSMADPNHNVFGETREAIRSTGSKVGGLAKTAAGAAIGGAAGAAVVNADDDDDDDEKPAKKQASRVQAENYSAPDPASAGGAQSLAGGPAPAALPPGPGVGPAAAAGGATAAAPGPSPVPGTGGGLPQAPHVYGAPPAGAIALPGGPVPQAPVHTPDETPALTAVPHVDEPTLPGTTEQPDGAEHDVAAVAGGRVANPDEAAYYTPEGEQVAAPEFEPMAMEPEVDDQGEAVFAFYDADKPDTPTVESAEPTNEPVADEQDVQQ